MYIAVLFAAIHLLYSPGTQGQNPPAPAPPAPSAATQAAPQDQLAKARVLIQQGKLEQALSDLIALQGSHPDLKGLDHELGVAYYRKGDYIKAAENLKKALARDAADNEAVQLLGLSYYLSGRAADAIPLLRRVQSWYPIANVDASYILGKCYIQQHQYDDARKAFATMYGVPPDSAPSYLFAARMLLREEYDPVAEQYAQKAIALDSKLPLAHYFLGELYLYKSRIPEAIAEFQKELALNPAHAPTYYKLADAQTRVLKWDEAERLLQRSIWLDATATGPYILMGKVLLNKGEPQLAVRTLQHALQMDPNNYIAHHLLGESYRAVGQTEQAAQELQLASQLQARQSPRP
jgi:tetratricopeptide (TPR) repeat protein